jgi:hypothetical protein
MKCFKCGTEYIGFECPTCAQKRLSEERNRLLEKQNRELAEQRRENERQTRELEQQNKLLEQEKWERDYEKQQEKDKAAFDVRLEELYQYATERDLIPVYVYAKYQLDDDVDVSASGIYDLDLSEMGISVVGLIDDMIKSINVECMKDFLALIDSLDSDDRILKASDYGMCFRPEFKLGDLQGIKETHNFDFVIVPQDKRLALFPLELIQNQSLKGYSGKKLQIGEFNYLIFLKDKKEAGNIAKILSESSRKYNLVKTEFPDALSKIKNLMEDYIKNNPKPKGYVGKSVSGAIVVILAIIGAIVGGVIGKVFLDVGSVFVNYIIFPFFGACGFGAIGFKIYGAMDDSKTHKKHEHKKTEEAEKVIKNWRAKMKQYLEKCIENISGDIKKKTKGNFIAIE